MNPIWAVRLNVLAFLDGGPEDGDQGYINVVATATSPAEAEQKVREVLAEYGWTIYSLEEVWEIDSDRLYEDPYFNEVIEDVLAHPDHVRLSTLHSYKVD